jgi:hypothetical protein
MRQLRIILRKLHQNISRLTWIILVAVLALNACGLGGQPSDKEIDEAKIKVSQIRNSLYLPKGVTLLKEILTYGTNPRLYPGCVTGMVYISYRTSRTFEEVLNEYREALKIDGWEPSPNQRHDQPDVDFFVKGPQVILEISSSPLRPDLLLIPTLPGGQNLITYYLGLLYFSISRDECSEI